MLSDGGRQENGIDDDAKQVGRAGLLVGLIQASNRSI